MNPTNRAKRDPRNTRRSLRVWRAAAAAALASVLMAACGSDDGDSSSGGGSAGQQVAAPVIATQPANASASAGASATFTVQASGDAPLAYQWQRNSADIAGATAASYTTPALAAADDGTVYRVVVSNGGGSVTSAGATLSVTAVAPTTGTLTLSGPGVGAVGAGTSYTPGTGKAYPTGPVCSGGSCGSSLKIFWTEGHGDQLMVALISNNVAEPGATPGTQVDMVAITLAGGTLGSMGINFTCADCDPASLGITLDRTARTLSFADTTIPAYTGGPQVVLNGTLNY